MKIKKLVLFLFVAAAQLALVGCHEETESFDITLLPGKWVAGTEYYRYDNDGTGVTWDTGEDVSEEEAQAFTWEFNDETNRLTLIHQMEMGGVVPKYYTLKALTATQLSYSDNYGQTMTYTRVQ